MASSNDPNSVKVAIRVRPLIKTELVRGCKEIIEKTKDEPQISVCGAMQVGINGKSDESYTYSYVFMPEDPQDMVYVNSVQPLISKLFEGYNVTILAYGQTGSGKTYTMGTAFDGTFNAEIGIIPRAIQQIFDQIRKIQSDYAVTATCSFTELYQEVLYDLLSGKEREESVCDIRENPDKGIYIAGITEKKINTPEETSQFLLSGSAGRAVGATAMNAESSRSHAIFTINVKTTKLGTEGESTNAKFHLVDLAGSERSKKTKATGKRFKEGVKINQGLLALGNVISALGGGQTSSYISYRDSKLTRLLQDSLGGNSVTLMIACISPADYNLEETLSTLRYADRAKKIKNKPRINQDSQSAEIKRLNDIIHNLRLKLLQYADDENAGASAVNVYNEGAEADKIKLQSRTKDLERQISDLLNIVCENSYKQMVMDGHIENLHKEVIALIELLNNTCPAEYAVPDTEIYNKIKAITTAIEDIIQKYETELNNIQQGTLKMDKDMKSDIHVERKQAAYAQKQIDFQSKLRELDDELKVKENLLSRKAANSSLLLDADAEKTILEYANTIKNYEKELEELRLNQTFKVKDAKTVKLSEDRRLKIKQLEKELDETKKKARQYEKTKKAQEQDRKRIEDLQREIQEMKNLRIKLLRESRNEAENYKKWIQNREKEINHLKEVSRKQENQMKRMNNLHEKQQQVLRRKVEEAKAINKRLQDALEKGKKVQAMRANLKNNQDKQADIVQTWIDHEMSILMSIVDAQVSLKNLMKDRGIYIERLSMLKATVQKGEDIDAEIARIEEDLEMRNAQISDLQQKVVISDIETKIKTLPENFTTINEFKIAMKYILNALVELRQNFSSMKMKSEEMKAVLDASEERVESLTEELTKFQETAKEEKMKLEQDYEDRLMIFLQKRSKEHSEDQSNSMEVELGQRVIQLRDENGTLKDRIQELLEENEQLRTKRKAPKTSRDLNETYDLFEEEILSSDEEYDFEDSFTDPTWRNPKSAKKLRGRQATASLLKESLINHMEDNHSNKRSSNGQPKCYCKGSCATKQCGCKKSANFCAPTCRCTAACVNKPDGNSSAENDDNSSQSISEIPIKKGEATNDENIVKEEREGSTPKKMKTDVDFNNITTPYYPYEHKKRKPLFEI